MATRIPQRELRNDNASILNRVEAGETFVVTRNGVPVADLSPHIGDGVPPMFVDTKALVARRNRGSAKPDSGAWLHDIRESDVIDDDPFNSRE
jgi:prevent-host-death family protein